MSLRAAAETLLLIDLAVFFGTFHQQKEKIIINSSEVREVNIGPPDSSSAMSTLSDGKTISLDSSATGILINRGVMVISKAADGSIAYEGTDCGSGYHVSEKSIFF